MEKLTNYERETVICFEDSTDQSKIYTCNKALMRKLDRLANEFPEAYTLLKYDEVSVTYQAPKKLISFRKPSSLAKKESARQRALQSNFGRKK